MQHKVLRQALSVIICELFIVTQISYAQLELYTPGNIGNSGSSFTGNPSANPAGGYPAQTQIENTTTVVGPAQEATTQDIVIYQNPNNPEELLPIAITERDGSYILTLPIANPESGEIEIQEIEIASTTEDGEENLTIEDNRMSIGSIVIPGMCRLSDVRINLDDNSIEHALMEFYDGTVIEQEDGNITRYGSPQIGDLKELLSNTVDSSGQPYYTQTEGEDRNTITDALREAQLKFQGDLLIGRLDPNNLPQDALSFSMTYVRSDGTVDAVDMSPQFLSMLLEQELITFTTPDDENSQQLNVCVNGMQIPFSYVVRYEEGVRELLSQYSESGFLDSDGNIPVYYGEEGQEQEILVPFAALVSFVDNLGSGTTLTLNALMYAIHDIIVFNEEESAGNGLALVIYDDELLCLTLSQEEAVKLAAELEKFTTSNTTVTLPEIDSANVITGVIAQLEQIAATNYDTGEILQYPNSYTAVNIGVLMNAAMQNISDEAIAAISSEFQNLDNLFSGSSIDTEEINEVLERINNHLNAAMNRASLAELSHKYALRMLHTANQAADGTWLTNLWGVKFNSGDLSLTAMSFNNILIHLGTGDWAKASTVFEEEIEDQWVFDADTGQMRGFETAVSNGQIPEIDQALSAASHKIAIWRGATAAVQLAGMSILSIAGGSLLAAGARYLIASSNGIRNAVSVISASKIGKTAIAVGKAVIRVGNYVDEASEGGIALLGRPGALLAQNLSGLAQVALRVGTNALIVGVLEGSASLNPDNTTLQFLRNPLGFLFPITNRAGNLGDICEFLSLAVNAYRGRAVMPTVALTEAVPHYQTAQPISIRSLFSQIHETAGELADYLESLGFSAGLSTKIVSSPPLTEAQLNELNLSSSQQGNKLGKLYDQISKKFGNNTVSANTFFSQYIDHLIDIGITGTDALTALANITKYVDISAISSIDIATVHIYASTMYQIDQTFNSVITRNSNNSALTDQYYNQLAAIKQTMDTLANQALALYRGGARSSSNIPPAVLASHQAVARRALQELNMVATLLNPDNITLGTKDKKTLVKKFEYNNEIFIITIEHNKASRSSQARTNITVERENGGYIGSASDFATANGLSWDTFINYVAKELTHGPTNQTARREMASRFSFRIDLDARGVATLDMTSPYICAMLDLFGQQGEYHTPLFRVGSEAEFRARASELLSLFGF